MTEQGKFYIAEYKKGNVLAESMQTLYDKGYITKDEFTETVGHEPRQIDICPEKTDKEKLADAEEEISRLQEQIKAANDQQDFYENCIVEMAEIVYA